MEKKKLNLPSHNNTKNQFQGVDLNVYTKTIKPIEKNVKHLLAFRVGKCFLHRNRRMMPIKIR